MKERGGGNGLTRTDRASPVRQQLGQTDNNDERRRYQVVRTHVSRRYIEILHLANALPVLLSSNAISNSVRLSSTYTFIGGESATCPAAVVGSTIFPFRGVHNLLSALFFLS
jgi:hypothetical protein